MPRREAVDFAEAAVEVALVAKPDRSGRFGEVHPGPDQRPGPFDAALDVEAMRRNPRHPSEMAQEDVRRRPVARGEVFQRDVPRRIVPA